MFIGICSRHIPKLDKENASLLNKINNLQCKEDY